MNKSYSGSEPIIKELINVIVQTEIQLEVIRRAFQENQSRGEKLLKTIREKESKNQSVSPNLNEKLNEITYLREWHWEYINRFEKLIYECKSIFLAFEDVKNSSGLFVKSKRKKILEDAGNFVLLGRTYVETLANVFDGDYLMLVPGEDIKQEALKLLGQRLAK